MLESIVDALADRAELLIVDNCEHVLSAAAELTGAIIAGWPRGTILATSREPLRGLGERVVRVPSLDPTQAVELFRERAAASDDAVQFAAEDAATIRGICERLDGIPLAIELAASRLRSLTLDDLAVRLDDRFRVLSGSGRLAPERHHTMRATVAWSYQLLAESERIVFDRLAVFAGTFDLRAVEQVCAHPSLAVNGDIRVDPDEVLDVMSSLVDKSMVNVERDQRTMRYRLLETLRQFAEQRLTDRGEIRTLRDLHLNHYLRVADDARPLEMGPSQLQADAIFEREWDNIRSAVAWAGATGQMDLAEQLIWTAFPFAVLRMRYELEEWAVRLIEKESLDRPVPGRIVVTAAGFAMFAAEWERSLPLCQQTVARASDPESRALAWHSATISLMMLGRMADAKEARDRAQAALAESDDPFVRYWVLYSGMTVAVSTDRTSVPMWVDRLREHAESTGAPWMFPAVHMARGNLALLEGDHDRALESFRRVVEVSHTAHSMLDEGMGASRVITAALARTDAVFDDEIVEMLRLIRDTKSWTVVASACESIANRLARYGHLEPAAVMLGGLLAEPTSAHRANLRAETTERVGQLTDARRLIERGAGMTPADLVDYAFEQVHDLVASQFGTAVDASHPG